MRRAQPLISLFVVALFCGYLISATTERPARDEETSDIILLSRLAAVPAVPADPKPVVTPVPAGNPEERFFPNAHTPVDAALALPRSGAEIPPPQPQPHEREAWKGEYREVWAIVTAYCPCRICCGRSANGRTSTGTTAWRPGAAADPRALPYGTRIHVEGYGYTEIDDTGGAMRRNWRRNGMLHVDIRMTYHYQARRWGRRVMKIRVYDAGR